MRAFLAMLRVELTLNARRGETLLLTLGIPLGLLVFFSSVDVLPLPDGIDKPIEFLAPGVLALAIMSTGLVQIAIGVAFERQYGVLSRLGTTPLGRSRLMLAKLAATLVTELVQVVAISAVALLLGWSPSVAAVGAIGAAVLGTAAFGGLGLLMAGTLKGEMTLAAANGLYLVLLLIGGMVFPLTKLPTVLRSFSELLPAAALSHVVTEAANGLVADGRWWLTLGIWAVIAPIAAARFFRWE